MYSALIIKFFRKPWFPAVIVKYSLGMSVTVLHILRMTILPILLCKTASAQSDWIVGVCKTSFTMLPHNYILTHQYILIILLEIETQPRSQDLLPFKVFFS